MATPGIAIVLPTFWACYTSIEWSSRVRLQGHSRTPSGSFRRTSIVSCRNRNMHSRREKEAALMRQKRDELSAREASRRDVLPWKKKRRKEKERKREREKKQKGKTISSERVDSRSTVTRFHREWKPHIKPISGIVRVKKKMNFRVSKDC